MKYNHILLVISILLTACNPGRVDTKAVKEEMQEKKLFHISDTELFMAAEAVGGKAVHKLDSVQETAPCADFATTSSCDEAYQPVIEELAKEDVKVTRLFFSDWKPTKDLPIVDTVLSQAKASHDDGIDILNTLQPDKQGGFHYVAPIEVERAGVKKQIGIYSLRYSSKPAAREASRGKKGM